mgnify:FL=1
MFFNRCEALRTDYMLDLAGIVCCNDRIDTKLFQPFRKEKMTFVDFFGSCAPCLCKIKIILQEIR